jgi:AcrR family transcriptional regulator
VAARRTESPRRAAPARGSVRPRSPKGRRTSDHILATALEIMGREGYASLSIGKIASATGVRKGNLQYYFPTKTTLLRAVLSYQVNRQKDRWAKHLATAPAEPRARLLTMLRYENSLNRDEVVKAQAWEKWAFAAHDEEAGTIVGDWYDWVTAQYAILLAARPRPDPVAARRGLAACIYAQMEGGGPFFGKSGRRARAPRAMSTLMESAAVELAVNFKPPA